MIVGPVLCPARHNGPMDVLSRSLALFRSSWAVLRQDKELLLLPVISAITAMVCVAPFFGLVVLSSLPAGSTPTPGQELSIGPLAYVFMFVAYLIGSYVTIFFQAALLLAANERLDGGSPTLGWALSAAASNAGRILPWAVVSATVSVVLQAIQERSGLIGRIVVGLVGMAWTLVTFLVLPTLVIEQVGVREAFTRSAGAFKRTWGENVVVNGGLGLVMGLITLVVIALTAPVLILGMSSASLPVTIVGIVLMGVGAISVSVFGAALSGVFRTVLYRFAVLGEAPSGFTADQIEGAFRPKKARRTGLLG